MATNTNDAYPVQFDVDYSESRNRLTTFFRIFLMIPILILMLLSQVFLGLPVFLMILFRGKYPRWMFDAQFESRKFQARVWAYASYLVDEYPSTDEEQSVHLSIEYPDVETELNRFMPLIKWILAIPHYIVLIVLLIIRVMVIDIIAWLLILILGRYPRPLFDFSVGVTRYGERVNAYVFLLATDRYPPFSLSA